LTDGYYNYKMDMWGVGCVMFEIVALYPLFPGKPLPVFVVVTAHCKPRTRTANGCSCASGPSFLTLTSTDLFSISYQSLMAPPAFTAACPGNNELDQIQKIHAIIGTPPPELLAKLKKRSTHSSSFDFPPCEGSGLAKMLSHVPPDCADLISKLLAYNPEERLSARQALRHPYFRWEHATDHVVYGLSVLCHCQCCAGSWQDSTSCIQHVNVYGKDVSLDASDALH
jgi:serine/threonine protein kinase